MDIPWREKDGVAQAVNFLVFMDRQRGGELDPVRDLAREIESGFNLMSGELDRVCSLTCPGCSDNCCERATIWYDFRDLLYLYFGPGQMPEAQITKNTGKCSNLKTLGCILPRAERPFVCTWYFCPDQKGLAVYGFLNKMILEIKDLRIQMEDEFCRITSNRIPSGQATVVSPGRI